MKKVNYDINIDKLELQYLLTHEIASVLDEIEDIRDFYEFEIKRTNSNKNYKNTFEIILKLHDVEIGVYDVKFATLYYGSFNPIRNQMYISIENRELYSKNLVSIHYIEDELNLQFMTISKIDIAFDCDCNLINRYYKLIKNDNINYIVLNKKVDKNEEISILNCGKGSLLKPYINKSFYIKNKEGGLELNAYNKSLEIRDNDYNKQYIADWLGFDNIHRLEVRCNHKQLKDTLRSLNLTDEDVLYRAILDKDLLFLIYTNLLNRILRVDDNNEIYNFLKYVV
ncbi:hypothetical protein [Bacteroides cellulosilyticus]|uniref:hypothetical protein n=1 Tax=Bacteroides cellulosilyticus TaxID=246787 RepID=UPI0032C0167D